MSDIGWAMHHLAAAAAEMDAAIARRMGLPAGDYVALKHIVVADEPLGPGELGRRLGITSGAATGLVDRLERAGHVARTPHPHDRRRHVVTATPGTVEGMLAELRPLTDDLDRVAARLDDAQRRLVAEVLMDLAGLHRRHAR